MIRIKATKANATLLETEKLTSGRIGLPIRFEFSEEWDGLGVTSVYRAGNVVIEKVLTVGDRVADDIVPWEVLENPRVNLVVGLYGVMVDPETEETVVCIPTIWCGCGDTIEYGTDPTGADNTETPTASDVQQMLSVAQDAEDNIIREVEVSVGTHSQSEGEPTASATLTSRVGGGKLLSVVLDYISVWDAKSDFSGSYNDLTNKPTIPTVPTNVSAFNNDAGYLTSHQDISGKENKGKMTISGTEHTVSKHTLSWVDGGTTHSYEVLTV